MNVNLTKDERDFTKSVDMSDDVSEYGKQLFKENVFKYHIYSFEMIKKLGNKVIPMLKDSYTSLMESDEFAYLTPYMTSNKDIRRTDDSALERVVKFTKELNKAIKAANKLEAPLNGLDKEYFIKDFIEDKKLTYDEGMENLLNLMASDIIEVIVQSYYLKESNHTNQTVLLSIEGTNLSYFEFLCLSVYTRAIELEPELRKCVHKPIAKIEKVLNETETNILEFLDGYREDIQFIAWNRVLDYMGNFKTKRLDKAKGFI